MLFQKTHLLKDWMVAIMKHIPIHTKNYPHVNKFSPYIIFLLVSGMGDSLLNKFGGKLKHT